MAKDTFILAIDEGTSSAKAFIFNENGKIIGKGQQSFKQYYPKPGFVEHDPLEIWQAQQNAIRQALQTSKISAKNLAAIGITNQRETTILWDRKTGKPIYYAIVWQDRRTANFIDHLDEETKTMIKEKTGLTPDAYFSASKIKWLLDNIPNTRHKAEQGELLFGTVDTFLLYHLTGGRVHATDYTNASRTMLYDIHHLQWDEELLHLFNIPEAILPEVKESSGTYGTTAADLFESSVTISGCAGDQQAALFGQSCYEPGMVKNTFGTGNFILMNTGVNPVMSPNLLTTIAWVLDGQVTYALEGSVFITGAGIQWLISIGLVTDVNDIETLAMSVPTTEGVYFVPAFVGLGAPYWDQYARGTIVGLTRGTGKAVLARAALESIGYLSQDVLHEMEKDSHIPVKEIRVDGGAAVNDFLLQFHADIAGIPVIRPLQVETTALGAAYLAGLSVDYWQDMDELQELWKNEKTYHPTMTNEKRNFYYAGWKKAVTRAQGWSRELAQCNQGHKIMSSET